MVSGDGRPHRSGARWQIQLELSNPGSELSGKLGDGLWRE